MNQLSENVKALFFSQCLYQKVILIEGYANRPCELTIESLKHYPNGVLLLRKVEQLTESEISEMLTAIGWDFNIKYILDISIYITDRGVLCLKIDEDIEEINNIGVDYLRAKGFLLPFTYLQGGKPQTLTPEQIVEMGWVRIKE